MVIPPKKHQSAKLATVALFATSYTPSDNRKAATIVTAFYSFLSQS
jgi:hypothetical protein